MQNLPHNKQPAASRACVRRHWSRSTRTLVAVIILVFVFSPLQAQVSFNVAKMSHSEPVPGTPLVFRAELNDPGAYDRIWFRYRPFGAGEYVTLEMNLTGNTAVVQIPAKDVVPPFIEYYLVLAGRNGSVETNPPGDSPAPFEIPPSAPFQIAIRKEAGTSGVVFLSPEQFRPLEQDEVVVAFSLQETDSSIVREATQLWLDGADVSTHLVSSGDLFIFVPENAGITLSGGSHKLTVRLFNIAGFLHGQPSTTFTVAGPGPPSAPAGTGPSVSGSVMTESRYESISHVGNWYNRADIRLRGRMDEWSLVGNAFVTSDETRDRQPQNRFYGGVESPWLQAGYGDSYPVFPSLIMSGMRVRGFTGRLVAGPQVFMAAAGEVTRPVEGALLQVIPVDSLGVEQQRDPTAAYAPLPGGPDWGKFSYGTFERDLLVLRTETLLGRTGGIGITVLKGKDDIGSITYGSRPQENAVVGLDARGSFDNRRIELSGQAAFSAYNFDISSGTFTDAYIDTTFDDRASDVKTVKDVLGRFITVNDNLRPLSFSELATLAWEVGLKLNYFRNNFSAQYVFRGSDYRSFGQSYLRTDIQGVTLADRISLSDNQILLSLGFELLQDNTSNFKAATTTFRNLTAAVSFYPRTDGPVVTIGFGQYSSDNGIAVTGADSLQSINDVDNRVYLQSSYGFDFGVKHITSLNVSTSSRTDNSPRRLDVNSTTASIQILSRFRVPLETRVDVALSFNAIPTGMPGLQTQSDYATLSLSGIYRMFENIVSLEGRISPTFGDVDRTVYDGAIGYAVLRNLTLQMRFTYFANTIVPDDNIWRATLRYDL